MPQAQSFYSKVQPWVVCLSSGLFFFFIYMQVNLFNALAPALIRNFHLTASQVGQLGAGYFYADVLMLFPAGIILDRISPKLCVLVSMLVAILSTYFFSVATTFSQAMICRLALGIAGGFALLGCVRIASRWFLPRQLALVIGLIVTMAMFGGMMAQTPLTVVTDDFGWRNALFYDAVLGAILFVVMLIFIKDYPSDAAKSVAYSHKSELGFWASIMKTVTNTQNWLGGIYASLINLPMFLLGATWGSLYLVEIRHLSRDKASMVISMLFVGMVIGSPLVGWISDHMRKRKKPMVIGAIISIAVILMIMYLPNLSFFNLAALFLALGLAVSAQIIAYPLVAESNAPSLTGTAEGIASVLIMSGGFMIPLFPWLLSEDWSHRMVNHIPIYSLHNFHMAMVIMPVGFVIALLAALILRDTRCQPYTAPIKEDVASGTQHASSS